MEDQRAVELIQNCQDPQGAADTLVRHALDNFSHDNVTVLVVKLNLGTGAKDTAATKKLADGAEQS